jgi:hypothetical protein
VQLCYLAQGILGYDPGPLLHNCLALGGENLLGAPVELRVLYQTVAIGKPGVALGTAVRLLTLHKRKSIAFLPLGTN